MKNLTIRDFGTQIAPKDASNKLQKASILNHIEDIKTRQGTLLTLNEYRRSLDVPMKLFFSAMIAVGVLTINVEASETKGQNVYEPTEEFAEYFIKEGSTTLIKIDKLKIARKDFEKDVLQVIVTAMNEKANEGKA